MATSVSITVGFFFFVDWRLAFTPSAICLSNMDVCFGFFTHTKKGGSREKALWQSTKQIPSTCLWKLFMLPMHYASRVRHTPTEDSAGFMFTFMSPGKQVVIWHNHRHPQFCLASIHKLFRSLTALLHLNIQMKMRVFPRMAWQMYRCVSCATWRWFKKNNVGSSFELVLLRWTICCCLICWKIDQISEVRFFFFLWQCEEDTLYYLLCCEHSCTRIQWNVSFTHTLSPLERKWNGDVFGVSGDKSNRVQSGLF